MFEFVCVRTGGVEGNLHSAQEQLLLKDNIINELRTKYGVLLDQCSLFLDDDSALASVQIWRIVLPVVFGLRTTCFGSWTSPLQHETKISFGERVQRTKGVNNINPRFLACNGEEDYIGKVPVPWPNLAPFMPRKQVGHPGTAR